MCLSELTSCNSDFPCCLFLPVCDALALVNCQCCCHKKRCIHLPMKSPVSAATIFLWRASFKKHVWCYPVNIKSISKKVNTCQCKNWTVFITVLLHWTNVIIKWWLTLLHTYLYWSKIHQREGWNENQGLYRPGNVDFLQQSILYV